MKPVIEVLACFLVVIATTPLLRTLAVKLNILDIPNQRKIHKQAVPVLGGIAVYLGFLFGVIINYSCFNILWGILLGSTIILAVGLADDARGLSPQIRLSAQLAAAIIVIISGQRIDFLPNNLLGNSMEILLTLLWVIGLTNSFNYLDGIDGLSAGTAAIAALFFSIIAFQTHQYQVGWIALYLAVSCLGFLPFNFSRAKIFLGDAGSTFIGFTISGIALIGNWAEADIIRISFPILILGIPIFDMVFTTIMRIKDGKIKTLIEWLKYAGKDHFHHCLVDLGLPPLEAVLFIYMITVSFGLTAVIINYSTVRFVGILAILQTAIILTIIAVLMVVGKRRRSGWEINQA